MFTTRPRIQRRAATHQRFGAWASGSASPLARVRQLRCLIPFQPFDEVDKRLGINAAPVLLVVEDVARQANSGGLTLRRLVRGRVVGSVLGVRLAARPKLVLNRDTSPLPACSISELRRYWVASLRVAACSSGGMGICQTAADEKRLRGTSARQRQQLQQDLSRTASKKRSLRE
jgi:hypothetical protein